jgi:hypothetical protein
VQAERRAQALAGLLAGRLYGHAASAVKVPDADARAYYRAHPAFFKGRPFAEARPSIVRQLLGERRNRALSGLLAEMKREFAPKVEYFDR